METTLLEIRISGSQTPCIYVLSSPTLTVFPDLFFNFIFCFGETFIPFVPWKRRKNCELHLTMHIADFMIV